MSVETLFLSIATACCKATKNCTHTWQTSARTPQREMHAQSTTHFDRLGQLGLATPSTAVQHPPASSVVFTHPDLGQHLSSNKNRLSKLPASVHTTERLLGSNKVTQPHAVILTDCELRVETQHQQSVVWHDVHMMTLEARQLAMRCSHTSGWQSM